MLLSKDGNVMQALEGEKASVRKLYAKIGSTRGIAGCSLFCKGPWTPGNFQTRRWAFEIVGREVWAAPLATASF